MDHREFRSRIEEVAERCGLEMQGYARMPNHDHLIARDPKANVPAAMQWLNNGYAMWLAVVRVLEEAEGMRWSGFRDRYGDWGRDLALWFARPHTGLTVRNWGKRLAAWMTRR